MKTSSRVGRAEMDVFEADALCVDPFHDFDKSAGGASRRTTGGGCLRSVWCPMVGAIREGEFVERLSQTISMVRFSRAAVLQFARRADGDDFAGIDDGHAVAEAFGFLDVMRGHAGWCVFRRAVLR